MKANAWMRWQLGGVACALAAAVLLVRGQTGEEPGSAAPASALFPSPAPALALSPAESLAAFRVAPGFRVEEVAAEPLVEAPVAMTFDPQGRLWVVEMRDYMPDAGGRSGAKDAPRGRVVLLEDTDGDGRMDRRTVFLDNLTLPRAVALVKDGVLVAEPPNLWLCPFPGPDGKPTGQKKALVTDYATAGGQPEYLPNGLLRALDNWTYDAQSTVRFRFDAPDGKLGREPTVSRGQWGIAQDDWGRLFYNYNSDHLRGDVIPSEYLARNPNLRDPTGVNVPISLDQTVFPVHPTTGVNRGYQPDVLRPDGTLRSSTACCGPTIYRGELFPPEFRGAAFLCEPAGNLVRCDLLAEDPGGGWTTRNAFDEKEFLASTDERFRPVNVYTGPDGALYVVDMHRGVIQHTAYMTPYLRAQIDARGLAQPIGMGRIYRVVPEGAKVGALPKLPTSPAALVRELSSPNGTRRDLAQRLLVESGDAGVVPTLRELAIKGENPLGRLHALWTLQGLGKLDAETVGRALADAPPRLRAAAIRLSEPFLASDEKLAARVLALAADDTPEVRRQLALTLGGMPKPEAQAALAVVLAKDPGNEFLRDAVLSGLRGQELEFLDALLKNPAWASNASGRTGVFGGLARCVFYEGNPGRMTRLLDLMAAESAGATAWHGTAILDGLANLKGPKKKNVEPVKLDAAPDALAGLAATANGFRVRERLARVDSLFDWPGKTAVAGVPEQAAAATPTASPGLVEQARFERGKLAFGQTCGACHQPDGQGLEGLAPPLAGSSWVSGPVSRLARIALHGVGGEISVNGRTYQMEMPPMGALGDEQIAEILTYLRSRWGGPDGGPVQAADVTAVRAQTDGRTDCWTAPELLKVP